MNDYEYKTILTDGISVSICFQKSGKKYQENKNIDDNQNMIQMNTDLKYLKSNGNVKI